VPRAGDAAPPGGEPAAAGGDAAPGTKTAAGSTMDVLLAAPPDELASWSACAGRIWLLPPAAAAGSAAPSVGGACVEDGCAAAATGAVGGGGAAAPDTGKFPPPALPGDVLDCALLRPGLPDTSFSVPAKCELLPAEFAGNAVGGVSFAAACGAGATGVLKAGMDALMRKS
jgi:hypothetical protein